MRACVRAGYRPQKQKRDEARRRGKSDFYTSDATFDERFQLGYGMAGDKVGYWDGFSQGIWEGGMGRKGR